MKSNRHAEINQTWLIMLKNKHGKIDTCGKKQENVSSLKQVPKYWIPNMPPISSSSLSCLLQLSFLAISGPPLLMPFLVCGRHPRHLSLLCWLFRYSHLLTMLLNFMKCRDGWHRWESRSNEDRWHCHLPSHRRLPPRVTAGSLGGAVLFNCQGQGEPQPCLFQMDGSPICTLPIPTHVTNKYGVNEK